MLKALIRYDGTRYFGWQKTRYGPSIQGEIEKALFLLTQKSITTEAASRTDRGVHAREQAIRFSLTKPLPPKTVMRALNARLPSDIRVLQIEEQSFHPTLDAVGKEYRYRLCFDPVILPHQRLYSWHYYYPIEREKVNRAKEKLIGAHDFSAFSNRKEKNPLCTIASIEFDGDFWIRGDRFLYKMVRNIVGTLLYIGSGKIPEEALPQILDARLRKNAGITAPAHGLYLHKVFYPGKVVR